MEQTKTGDELTKLGSRTRELTIIELTNQQSGTSEVKSSSESRGPRELVN